MKSSGRGSRRNTAIRFLTWKDMAERRNEVMDMVAQVVSWAKAGGTNRFVRLPMSIRPRACEPSEPNEDTTKVQILILREPGGGLRLAPKYSRGPAASRALWLQVYILRYTLYLQLEGH